PGGLCGTGAFRRRRGRAAKTWPPYRGLALAPAPTKWKPGSSRFAHRLVIATQDGADQIHGQRAPAKLHVSGQRHAGHQAKVLGNSVEPDLVDAAVRLVVRCDGLIVLIRGERTLADPQHLSLGDAVFNIIECVDFDQARITSADETNVAGEKM